MYVERLGEENVVALHYSSQKHKKRKQLIHAFSPRQLTKRNAQLDSRLPKEIIYFFLIFHLTRKKSISFFVPLHAN